MTLLEKLIEKLPEEKETYKTNHNCIYDTENVAWNSCRTATIASLPALLEVIREDIKNMKIPADKMQHDLRGNCDFEKNHTIDQILNLLTPSPVGE